MLNVICLRLYSRSTKEFTRTRSEMSVYSRIEFEFGDVGFKERGK